MTLQQNQSLLREFPGTSRSGWRWSQLDEVDPAVVFRQRAAVMKSVPHVLRGPFRNVLKLALEEASWGNCRDNEVRQERGWKLFMLLPRMLLHRPPGGGVIPRSKFVARFEVFARGEWIQFLTASALCNEKAASARQRQRRRGGDDWSAGSEGPRTWYTLVSSLQQGRRWKALHWRPAPKPHWTNFKMLVTNLPSFENLSHPRSWVSNLQLSSIWTRKCSVGTSVLHVEGLLAAIWHDVRTSSSTP